MANLTNINNKFLVTTGGDVGIGTTSPRSKLEVDGGIMMQNGENLEWGNTYANNAPTIFASTNYLQFAPTGASGVASNSMKLTTTGLGIGTTSPVVKLAVKSSQEQLTLSEGDLRGATFDYRSSTGNLNIATNGINARTNPQFTLDLNGNVGIGTTSPSEKLYVASSAGYIATFQSTTATDFRPIRFLNSAGANVGFLGNNGSSNEFFLVAQDRPLIFGTGNGGAERMRIAAAGAVGIDNSSPDSFNGSGSISSSLVIGKGTSSISPQLTLWQGNSAQATINFASANTGTGQYEGRIRYTRDTGVMDFRTNSIANVLVLSAAGNVGIGTDAPTTKLTVNGGYANFTDGTVNIYTGSDGSGGLFGTITNHYQRFVTNNTERMRINSSGNIGIGETSPNGKLHIKDGLTCSIDIENTSNTGLGEITFNDPDADDRGALQYSHNNDAMIFKTSASERMRIRDDGSINLATIKPFGHSFTNGTINNGASVTFNANVAGGNQAAGFIVISAVPNSSTAGGAVGIFTHIHTQAANVYSELSKREENSITISESGGVFTISNSSGSTVYYQAKTINMTDFSSTIGGY